MQLLDQTKHTSAKKMTRSFLCYILLLSLSCVAFESRASGWDRSGSGYPHGFHKVRHKEKACIIRRGHRKSVFMVDVEGRQLSFHITRLDWKPGSDELPLLKVASEIAGNFKQYKWVSHGKLPVSRDDMHFTMLQRKTNSSTDVVIIFLFSIDNKIAYSVLRDSNYRRDEFNRSVDSAFAAFKSID